MTSSHAAGAPARPVNMRRVRVVCFIDHCIAHRPLAETSLQTRLCRVAHRRRQPLARPAHGAASVTAVAATTALDKESEENRYVDLRTLKTVRWEDAHLINGGAVGCRFGPFEHPVEGAHVDVPPELVFSHETVPLNQGQRDAVRAILSRRSVLFHSSSAEAVFGIALDLALRARVWRQTMLYCAPSVRSAEAMHAALSAQLSSAPPGTVVLDTGDVNSRPSIAHLRGVDDLSRRGEDPKRNGGDDSANEETHAPVPNVIVTVPAVLRKRLVSAEGTSWINLVDVAILDNPFVDEDSMWEELLLGMPNRIPVFISVKDISVSNREQLLLWFETVHNSVVPILPPGCTSVLDRIERCVDLPVLRAFVYNASLHSVPVQVSLPLLRDLALQELSQQSAKANTDYSAALLHGVTVMEAAKPEDLLFRSSHEAEYADFVSLLLHDSKKTEKAVRAKSRKRAPVKKNRTPSSMSAARKRRNVFYSESLLFPAIMLVQGRLEAMSAANALISAADDDTKLLWDDGSREHLHDVVHDFMRKHSADLDDEASDLIAMLTKGIGVVQAGMIPALRLLVTELFRAGFIPALFVDTYIGPSEISTLPSAKTAIIQSSAFAEIDDQRKGLVKGSTVASLAGRVGKDDVGNIIVMWYDEAVDDAEASADVASSLLLPAISENQRRRKQKGFPEVPNTNKPGVDDAAFLKRLLGPHRVQRSNEHLWSSYAGVLRSLRSFGLDGYRAVLEYTADSYQGWLVRAALRATREKMQVEQKALDERLADVNWSEVALHDRRLAKHQECVRVLKAMKSYQPTVLSERIVSLLGGSTPGTIIGVRTKTFALEAGENGDSSSVLAENGTSSGRDGGTQVAVAESNIRTLAKTSGPEKDGTGEYVPAVLVAVLDRSTKKAKLCPIDAQYVVICIMMDGVWTMVPSTDVVAEAAKDVPQMSDVDLLDIPHLAIFDLDPVSGWAKCKPISDTEITALERVSDELIGEVTTRGTSILKQISLPEYEKQKLRVGTSLRLLQETVWYGKDDELLEIRGLRRRSAKVNDDAVSFQETEARLERVLTRNQENRMNAQRARLAVLEDCNAVRIHSDDEMEMTPIGALASILPGPYPLFTSACLLLVDGLKKLSAPELAAFVSVASGLDGSGTRQGTSSGFTFSTSKADANADSDDEDGMELNSSNGRTPLQGTREVDDLDGVLPSEMLNVLEEILRALHMLQHRHTTNKTPMGEGPDPVVLAEVAPGKLGLRGARPSFCFANGDDWESVVSQRGLERGDAVRELRTVTEILSVIARGGAIGEFDEVVQEKAQRAIGFMQRWPVCDTEDATLLVESGVVFKEWNGQSYDRWWRANRDPIRKLVQSVETNYAIKSVVAEVME